MSLRKGDTVRIDESEQADVVRIVNPDVI